MKLHRSFVSRRGISEGNSNLPAYPLHAPESVRVDPHSLAQVPSETGVHFRSHFWVAALFAIAAATAVIGPMLVLGTVSGRDFPFHLASWMDVAKQWHHGTIYPQWAESANWGFGEPRFVFYPPASWMLGALLGSLLPWSVVPTAFNWLALIAAGMSMYLLARESLPGRQAALAAMFFAANPYHLLLVYYRSDFAELLASAFFPLLPWGVIRIARYGWRGVPMLAAAIALIWLCNAPAAVIAVYSVVFLFLIAYVVHREFRVLIYGAVATAAGFGLAAFYILPAAHERSWVQITQVLSDGLRPEQNFLFSRANSMLVNTDFNLKISLVVLLMGALAAAVATYFAKTLEIPRLHYWLVVALGGMSFFMMFRFSRPLWLFAPELRFVQFPWRYAVPLGVAFSFLLGAVSKFRRLEMLAIALFVFAGPLAKIWLAVERPSSWTKADVSQFERNFNTDIGYRGTPEYLPNAASVKLLRENWTNFEIARSGDGAPISKARGDRNTFAVDSPAPQTIVANVFDYPTWAADVDGSPVNSKRTDSDGRILVDVQTGKHSIHLWLQRKWDAKLGIALSLSTAVLLSSFIFVPWRQGKPIAPRHTNVDSTSSSSTLSAVKTTTEKQAQS